QIQQGLTEQQLAALGSMSTERVAALIAGASVGMGVEAPMVPPPPAIPTAPAETLQQMRERLNPVLARLEAEEQERYQQAEARIIGAFRQRHGRAPVGVELRDVLDQIWEEANLPRNFLPAARIAVRKEGDTAIFAP